MQKELSQTSKAADLRDFQNEDRQISTRSKNDKLLLSNRLGRYNRRIQLTEEDVRSNRSQKSEYDYGSKRKFIDVLRNSKKGNHNPNNLNQLYYMGKREAKDALPAIM